MSQNLEATVKEICQFYGHDPARMMDIVCGVQARLGGVNDEAIDLIAVQLRCPRVKVCLLYTSPSPRD